jgi:hypothetical protein
VIDPTKNVLDLTSAANKRQDDLREMHNRYLGAEIRRLEETIRWMEKLSDAHQKHDREIHLMEQQKLEAFRKSDETARLTEAERTLAAVQLVARAAETTANDIRAVLNTTATTLAQANAARDLEYNNRISALEKSSYEGAGKGTGAKNTVTYAIIAVGLLVSLITIGSVVVGIAFAIRPR